MYRAVHSYLAKTKISISAAISSTTSTESTSQEPAVNGIMSSSRLPVYFLGIGGPNFMENTAHPAYAKLATIGREITTQVKPKAIVVFSAHWQEGPSRIKINAAEQTDIIYDFYGFPPHYYEYKFPNKGSPALAQKVVDRLGAVGIEVEKVQRGLDHGVWAGFIVAFDPEKNPLNVPIVQVSLFSNEDSDQHYRMGQALAGLRDEGVLIIGAGMAVHNLHDFRATRGTGATMPYAYSFDKALKEAACSKPDERQTKMLALMERSDARKAHPSVEHILPFHVAAGAADGDAGERLWTFPEGSLSWAQYRFGQLPA
ncbi:LigB subunit of an aromatic-ring-opening dioxygenase LigAB [Glarea lozoyensis ATCC 20868]|uniref:LigB subunit of an aromatic-ring-opening dioxygenase LigAB n=2 Tax=Glarea lozoyensis TaxID=101852 RepID=S3CJV1_GLAL2|nr:LigB subunit of an aromatic-ring-opening dioxygenase LigAB [Glarea lozoyensis ATCC 20868]EHL00849.1 hypothetical protein M7I_3241 [Glarea lozoyensis 74030]EPE26772.1 LigB subunit of an aromatic-ring-opening dioxygenase LigAB [Glarea lozoyensis ATCC 20868]